VDHAPVPLPAAVAFGAARRGTARHGTARHGAHVGGRPPLVEADITQRRDGAGDAERQAAERDAHDGRAGFR
jgi:hypothetical protein